MLTFPDVVLLIWPVLVLFAFLIFPARHLVAAGAFVAGLLFLPMVYDNQGLRIPVVGFSKYRIISIAVLLGLFTTDKRTLLRVRPSWVDLPIILWCLCPIPSVLLAPPPPDGSPSWKDALVQTIGQCLVWGVPYLVGRKYFSTLPRLRDLAVVVLLGGVAYVPLCLVEIRMSPQLHLQLYGFSQHEFLQTMRFGGWRPMVFMQHGLAVALFMTAATLIAFWLWWSNSVNLLPGSFWKRYPNVLRWFFLSLVVTTVLIKSVGALILGFFGLGTLLVSARLRTRAPLLILVLVVPLYLSLRLSGAWSGTEVVPFLTEISADRAESFEFRELNEDLLMDHAAEAPFFGWGGWDRFLVHDDRGRNISTPDGLWIIALGNRGLPGLIALFAGLLLPVLHFLRWYPPAGWSNPQCAAAAVCAVIVTVYAVDNLMNDEHNHVFILMAGALAGLPSMVVSSTWFRPPATAIRQFDAANRSQFGVDKATDD